MARISGCCPCRPRGPREPFGRLLAIGENHDTPSPVSDFILAEAVACHVHPQPVIVPRASRDRYNSYFFFHAVFAALPAPGQKRPADRLAGAADALYLAELALSRLPLVVVCAGAWDAQRLADELRWFDPQLRYASFPTGKPCLRYLLAHPDLISERLATLYQITRREFDIALVALERPCRAWDRRPPRRAHFFLKQKDRLDEAAFRVQMALGGYHHVNQVFSRVNFPSAAA